MTAPDPRRDVSSFQALAAEPYTVLAAGYEEVMAHVDYEAWADYLHHLLGFHAPGARDVVELGCGTGALARALQPLGPPPAGFRYRAFDGAPAMIAEARRRAGALPVTFGVADFADPIPGPPADVALLLYDGLNYLLETEAVGRLFARVAQALRPGGVFVFDQSTPANSLNNADGFDDAGTTAAFSYVRESRYDAASRLHTTTLRMTLPGGAVRAEQHVQRAYTLGEIAALLAAAPLEAVAAYDGFSSDEAGEDAERIHWVVQRPA
ncbi:MAG: class I SAM-dependent DNA methyltransferase [Rubricoccaceae bacterium]